ncbi:MAG: ionic transporter y4hA [Actinomycetia bacterium]|nr:ionic transporter y4hA [Actinomycetes bacterium]
MAVDRDGAHDGSDQLVEGNTGPNAPRRSAAEWASIGFPLLALATLAVVWGRTPPVAIEIIIVIPLAGAVLAAVHHAEVVAHRVGEPFGSLILAVAVTLIEVGLIVSLMVSGGDDTSSLARDTVFAAVMITSNGIFGLTLLIGALRQRVAVFNPEGTGAALSTVVTLTTVSLVLPAFTRSEPGPVFSASQLVFAALASLALYVVFVVVQNVRHVEYFLPPDDADPVAGEAEDRSGFAPHPSGRTALASLGLLLAALVGVVGLAKVESHPIESAVRSMGFPPAFVGVIIAVLVLAPETLAAARHALRDRVQIGVNLALGSAIASVGLTIPAIAFASIWLSGPLTLGLGGLQIALLALTAGVGVLTVMPGRATLMQASVHLWICAAFVLLAAKP